MERIVVQHIVEARASTYACNPTCLMISKGPRHLQSSFLDGCKVEILEESSQTIWPGVNLTGLRLGL